jgi:hypothetical protein
MFISRVAEALYLQRIEKIYRFQDGPNSHKDYLPAFKMVIPIIAFFGDKLGGASTKSMQLSVTLRCPIDDGADVCDVGPR